MNDQKSTPAKVDALLDELLQDYAGPEAILGEQGLLKQLTKRLVEKALQAELTHYLQLDPACTEVEPAPEQRRNTRNGFSRKTIQAELGQLQIQVPRDRHSEFEPALVKKGQRRISGLDDKILALYARGLSTRDIQAQLEELYGVEISAGLISEIINAVVEDVRQWQSRALDKIYPIVWLDALYLKVRNEGRVRSQAVYLVLGVNLEGHKELLGMWMAPSEGAKFWLGVLTELKNRGARHLHCLRRWFSWVSRCHQDGLSRCACAVVHRASVAELTQGCALEITT